MKAVNLIPGDDRGGAVITAGRSGGGVIVIIGLLAGLAVLALLYGLADHHIASDRAEVASLTARAQQAQARAGELSAYTSFLQMREQRVQAVTALVDSRFDWAHAFHELGRVLPPGKVSLTSVDGTVGAASTSGTATSSSAAAAAGASSVTSATPPGSIPTFTLTGCAVSQAEVALMLDRLRLIDGVSEVTLQSSTASNATGGGAAAGCEGGDPAFTAQVIFDALPTVPAAAASAAAATTVATPSTGATTSGASAVSTVPAVSPPASSASATSSSGAIR